MTIPDGQIRMAVGDHWRTKEELRRHRILASGPPSTADQHLALRSTFGSVPA
jgi:hypothetical protein